MEDREFCNRCHYFVDVEEELIDGWGIVQFVCADCGEVLREEQLLTGEDEEDF